MYAYQTPGRRLTTAVVRLVFGAAVFAVAPVALMAFAAAGLLFAIGCLIAIPIGGITLLLIPMANRRSPAPMEMQSAALAGER
jgi:hypothetical protein